MRIVLLLGVLGVPALARAWPTADCAPGPFAVHGDIAARVLDEPAIAPHLTALGLSRETILADAALEPTCFFAAHPGWGDLRDRVHLTWPLTDASVGVILHVGGDSGVPSCHGPANELYCSAAAETRVEADGELAGAPAFPGALPGTYDDQVAAFHDDQVALTLAMQTYIGGNVLCPALCDLSAYAVPGMENGEQLAYAALLLYLEPYVPLLPDAGPADAAPPPDAAPPADAAPLDAGTPDAEAPDAADSAADAGAPPPVDPGCGCRTGGGGSPWALAALAVLAALCRAGTRRSAGGGTLRPRR